MVRIGGMRLVAALIDFIIAGVAAWIVRFVVLLVLGTGVAGAVISGLLGAAVVLGYFYLEVLKGQAIGKQIFKFQITSQDGSPASKEQLTKRYLVKMAGSIVGAVGSLIAFIPIVGLLVGLLALVVWLAVLVFALMMLRENRLAYYDELAGTAVYGPGTAPAGFPVSMPGQAAPPPPPPTA